MQGMGRGLLVWLLIMLAESVHGVLRGLLLVPRIGEEAAARIGWPVGAIIVLAIAYLAIGWTRVRERGRLLAMGALWAVLTVAFEIAIGLVSARDEPVQPSTCRERRRPPMVIVLYVL